MRSNLLPLIVLMLATPGFWVTERTWPGYPYAFYRWYYGPGHKSPYGIEWYRNRLPPRFDELDPPGTFDPLSPGTRDNL